MGHIPMDWEDAGRLSPSGDTEDNGTDATAEWGQDLDIPSSGGVDGGCGNTGDRNLCHLFPEHFHEIYYDKANYVPVSGVGAASRGTGFETVVISRYH